jgi:hypothetical protein
MYIMGHSVGVRYGGKGDRGEVNRIENRTGWKFKNSLFLRGTVESCFSCPYSDEALVLR